MAIKPCPLLTHPLDPTLVLVPLTRGYFAVISAVDAAEVGRFNWFAMVRGPTMSVYACRSLANGSRIYLHSFVAELARFPASEEIDHESVNGLDCRRSNLRPATHGENERNKKVRADSRSGIKGLAFDPLTKKWRGRVTLDGKVRRTRRFSSQSDAHEALKELREELHGAFVNHGTA